MDIKKRRPRGFFQKLLWLSESSARVHKLISYILLLIMAVQPLQGLFSNALTSDELIALFLGRAGLIRGLGYGLLLNALVYFIRCAVTYGDIGTRLQDTFLRRPWNTFFLLLLLWACVCTGHAAERGVALYGDPVRYEGISSYFAYAGFLAGAGLVREENRKRTLFYTMGATAVLLAALSVIRYYTRTDLFLSYMDVSVIGGLSGTFVNTNHFGYYLCTMAAVLFGAVLLSEKAYQKILCFNGGLFLCAVLIINNTLGSIIAIILGALVLLLGYALRKGGKTRLIALCGTAGVLVFAVALLSFSAAKPETNQLTRDIAAMLQDVNNILTGNVTGHEGSDRLGVWMADLELFKTNPLMGCGTDNAYYAIEPYYGTMKMPHNEYLAMFVNLGIPGGALYLLALLSLAVFGLRRLFRMQDVTFVAGCAALTYAASAFFGVSLCTMLPFFYIFLRFFADDSEDSTKSKDKKEIAHAKA